MRILVGCEESQRAGLQRDIEPYPKNKFRDPGIRYAKGDW